MNHILTASLLCLTITANAAPNTDCGTVMNQSTLRFQNQTLIPIDEDGVYFYDPVQVGKTPMPENRVDLKKLYADGSCPNPVRLELVDFIDCTQTDHGYTESRNPEGVRKNQPARVLNINGKNYRVTACPKDGFDLMFYSYFVKGASPAGTAHLVLAEMPNDIERYTSISFRLPEDQTWLDPYAGAEKNSPNCQSGNCIYPGAGLTVYNGREFPLDGKPFTTGFFFYPKSDLTRLTVATSGWYRTKTEESGAAVSRIWIFKVAEPLSASPAKVDVVKDQPQRNIGIYMPHPWYLLGHYGIPANKAEDRAKALGLMADQLAMSGINWLEFNAINGSDRSGVAWYEGSSYFGCLVADLLKEMPPITEKRGINLIPIVTSLLGPSHQSELPPAGETDKWGFSRDSYLFDKDGVNYTKAFGSRNANPLRPEVQDWLIRFIKEIGERTKDQPSVKGIGFRVNGKIGLCFTAHEDRWKGAKETGYGQWDLSEFKKDTGVDVPMEPGKAYDWLRERPEEWEKWINWRCVRTREFWLRVRDVVVAMRPDWDLYVKTVLPSEVPGTNIEWAEGESAYNLLRHHGYDPKMFVDDKDIVIERTMMVAEDRYFTRERWGEPDGKNSDNFKKFHYQPNLASLYQTKEGPAVEIYQNYFELQFHLDTEFGGPVDGFRTDTPSANGRNFYEPITFSLRETNPQTLALMGWEIPTLGHEADLRRFSQNFRALPYVEPVEIKAKVEPANEKIWVRLFGDRLAVVNDQMTPAEITITFDKPLPDGHSIRDIVSNEMLIPKKGGTRDRISLPVRQFDLRTLAIEPSATTLK